MGRYETLNPASKDVVNCLLPGIAANFEIDNVVDVIPADIRMREWDCERKEHIIDQPENDPRNWGLQFLKDLVTISRIKKGQLAEFHDDLRTKVENHDPHEKPHPWARLADIKDLKEDYEHPGRRQEKLDALAAVPIYEESSTDESYYELVEREEVGPKKRGRPPGSTRDRERYEPRHQKVKVKHYARAPKRLRRDDSVGWERREKLKRRPGHNTPVLNHETGQDDPIDGRTIMNEDNFSGLTLSELELQLQVAEAELKTARLRLKVTEARRQTGARVQEQHHPAIDYPGISDVPQVDQAQTFTE